jgi:predicted enzyme related to lactoylglutathione lyase
MQRVFIALAAALAGCAAPHQDNQTPPPATAPIPTEPKRVTGIGGIFFKCNDPAAMRAWYAKHLGIQATQWGATFEWRQTDDPSQKGSTLWTPFPAKTKYFSPSTKPYMINYRVQNLDWLIAQLNKEGINIVGKVDVESYGKFCHIMDPEGNLIELWEPIDAAQGQPK